MHGSTRAGIPPRPQVASPEEDPNVIIQFSSPPCLMHELAASWLSQPRWEEVRAWRKTERAALIARRLAIGREERLQRDAAMTPRIRDALLPRLGNGLIGFYWPFRGEYDPRPLARALHADGVCLALPVVVTRAAPMIFRRWWPGMRLVPGIWDIPIPAEGEPVTPEVLLVPLVGFDKQGYRLGYGGGYYDRTLAAMAQRPLTIGIGFGISRLATIHPQPHDVPMDLIITESESVPTGRTTSRGAAG